MDLVTLITSCALSVEPKLMHALIFEQSDGEPWSFLGPGEALPRMLPTLAACRTQVSIFVCADDGVTPHGD